MSLYSYFGCKITQNMWYKRTIIPKSSIRREKFKVIVRPKLRTFAPEIQKVIIND